MSLKKSHTTVRKFQKGHDSQHTCFNIGRKTVNKSTNSNLLPAWFFNSENPKFPAGNYNIAVTLMCADLLKTIILTWLEGCVSPSLSRYIPVFFHCCLCVPLTCWAWDCSQALTNCFSSARAWEETIRLCEFAEALNVSDLGLFLAPLSQTSSVLAQIDVWSRAVYISSILSYLVFPSSSLFPSSSVLLTQSRTTSALSLDFRGPVRLEFHFSTPLGIKLNLDAQGSSDNELTRSPP